jgi:LPXTG-site transpeptidase (sortase) family protein
LVTDDLTDTFPLPTTFEVQSITSTDTTLILNNNPDGTPIFTGSSNINLLGPGNSLEVGQSKSFTLVVRVIPTSYGPYSNSAIAYGTSPKNVTVNDLSQAGVDPDPDHDNDPRNNNAKTSASFTGRIFDPPFGIKTLNANLQPYLQWTMVWINDTNIVGVNAVVHDPIPVFTEYVPGLIDSGYGVPSGAPAGSTSLGVSCTATEGSTATTTTLCYYEGPTDTYPRGQIIWQGILGPDLGVVDPKDARNAISITFGVRVNDSLVVSNNAFIDSDLNGDGDVDDAGERSVALASFVWDITPANLPATGFAPNQVSLLPKQASLYNGLGNIWLEVPKLGLKMPIVGVPMEENIWDVSWLGDKAGWLDETAYPTSSGNSVITGHVYLPNGKPGPFIDLKKLSWNDIITIHVGDKQFNYRVRQAKLVKPDDLTVLKSESSSWITLVTCQGYDEESDSYLYRQVVRAVLVDTK